MLTYMYVRTYVHCTWVVRTVGIGAPVALGWLRAHVQYKNVLITSFRLAVEDETFELAEYYVNREQVNI